MNLENLKEVILLQSAIIEKLVLKQLEFSSSPIDRVPEKQELKNQLNELKVLLNSFK